MSEQDTAEKLTRADLEGFDKKLIPLILAAVNKPFTHLRPQFTAKGNVLLIHPPDGAQPFSITRRHEHHPDQLLRWLARHSGMPDDPENMPMEDQITQLAAVKNSEEHPVPAETRVLRGSVDPDPFQVDLSTPPPPEEHTPPPPEISIKNKPWNRDDHKNLLKPYYSVRGNLVPPFQVLTAPNGTQSFWCPICLDWIEKSNQLPGHLRRSVHADPAKLAKLGLTMPAGAPEPPPKDTDWVDEMMESIGHTIRAQMALVHEGVLNERDQLKAENDGLRAQLANLETVRQLFNESFGGSIPPSPE